MPEFDRITERGGVLGAMETMYQRSRIQEESLYYETLKHTGEYPIIGVNTFLSSKGSPTVLPKEVIPAFAEAPAGRRATEGEGSANLHTTGRSAAWRTCSRPTPKKARRRCATCRRRRYGTRTCSRC